LVEEPCPLSLPYGFLHPLPFAYVLRGTVREWRSKFDGSDVISVYFSHSFNHTKWKRAFEIRPIFRIIVMN